MGDGVLLDQWAMRGGMMPLTCLVYICLFREEQVNDLVTILDAAGNHQRCPAQVILGEGEVRNTSTFLRQRERQDQT